jgi:exodeoxyribonuclease-5
MIQDTFFRCFEREFPFEMTPMQRTAAEQLSRFVLNADSSSLFILRGYAGTGKTTLVASLVKVLFKLQRRVTLMAPTGRAAKVFSQHAAAPAYTIHKVIYRQKRMDDQTAGFSLNINKARHTLFIVDEASMIANEGGGPAFFGSGRLLDDLLRFVYSAEGCRLLFVGDTAQLPPVGEEESPALSASLMSEYGFHVTDYELTEVMRQAEKSGILQGATRLRHTLMHADTTQAPMVKFSGFKDIRRTPGSELIEALEDSYDSLGTEQTIVITRSNKRAVAYNNGIRSTIFGREEGLVQGDVVMISKNNYFWIEQLRAERGEDEESALPMDFIANGDIAIVDHIGHYHDFYGLHFADVSLTFPDYDNFCIDVRVILDALQSESPSLSPEQSDRLFKGVMDDYAEYSTKKKRMEKLRQDPNYNAVQIKYAYAVTCHKAQGGQWEHVFVDQGWVPEDHIDANYYRWLYTAFTRATTKLDLVNWPEKQCE